MGKIAVKKCCKKVALGKPKTGSSNCCGKKRFKKVRKEILFFILHEICHHQYSITYNFFKVENLACKSLCCKSKSAETSDEEIDSCCSNKKGENTSQ